MKKIIYFSLITLLFFSCKSTTLVVTPMGQINSVSTRNIDGSKKYIPLMTYAGVSSSEVENAISKSKKGRIKKKNPIYKEIIKFKGNTINEAVDNVVKTQVGGEYLMNVRFYLVQQRTKEAGVTILKNTFVASGDVWGLKDSTQNIKGFKVKDKVIFTYNKELKKVIKKNFEGTLGMQYSGTIINLMGAEATVKLESGVVLDIPYNNLKKTE
jgi:hypothetical protein